MFLYVLYGFFVFFFFNSAIDNFLVLLLSFTLPLFWDSFGFLYFQFAPDLASVLFGHDLSYIVIFTQDSHMFFKRASLASENVLIFCLMIWASFFSLSIRYLWNWSSHTFYVKFVESKVFLLYYILQHAVNLFYQHLEFALSQIVVTTFAFWEILLDVISNLILSWCPMEPM